EQSGLGKAPFRYVGQPGKDATDKAGIFWCEHCGTTLKHRHFVRSSDGVLSIVGIDCLNKTGDAGLIDAQKADEHQQRLVQREEDQKASQNEREAAFHARYGM